MSRTVWKYELPGTRTTLSLPVDSKPLHVAAQGNSIQMWVEVDPAGALRERTFYVVGTGHAIPSDTLPPVHVGSFLADGGAAYVFHVYESLDARLTSAMTASGKGPEGASD